MVVRERKDGSKSLRTIAAQKKRVVMVEEEGGQEGEGGVRGRGLIWTF